MQSSEQNLYANFTKSIVNGFEEFINSLNKNGEVLSDVELSQKLKQIGKKLQTLFNKWENQKERDSSLVKRETHEEVIPKNKVVDEEWDEFNEIIANRIVDVASTKDDTVLSTEVSSTSTTVKMESSDTNISMGNTTLTRKEVELIRKFKLESIKEEWIHNEDGFYILEYSPGSWKCSPCKLDNLSIANIVSHLSGKNHHKKIDSKNREVSETRKKCDYDYDLDLSSTLTDVEPEFLKKRNGADIIIPFRGFYCNACSSTINSEESLKLHINGGKHRKNCQS